MIRFIIELFQKLFGKRKAQPDTIIRDTGKDLADTVKGSQQGYEEATQEGKEHIEEARKEVAASQDNPFKEWNETK